MSHFSAIGFPIGSLEDLAAWARRGLASAMPLEAPGIGTYYRCDGGGGAELWLTVDEERRLTGVNPHFASATRHRVRLIARQPDEAHPMDGAFHLWVNPVAGDLDPESGDFPLLVDVPDVRRHDGLALPVDAEVEIGAFAERVEVFADEAAFRATGSVFATASLIPSGLFVPGGELKVPARAEAILTGVVQAAETRTNAASGLPFTWARLATFGGDLEVVADPRAEALAAPPAPGSIVSGTFWLSGRLVEPA